MSQFQAPPSAPGPVGGTPQGNFQPHRGVMILVFGILGWLVCVIFGIVAWVMGNTDLQAMAVGRMDPTGEGLTKAGKIIGMISVIFTVVMMVIGILFVIIGLAVRRSLGGQLIRLEPAPRRIRPPLVVVLVTVVWLALVAANTWIGLASERTTCVFKRTTSIPCPTCGATRAVLATGRGDLPGAFLFNPFIAIAAVVAITLLVMRIGFGRRVVMSRSFRRWFWPTVAVLFLVNWGYLIRAGI